MTIKHTNPTQMRYDEKDDVFVQAHAPYNFVPLPEKMVPARTPIPPHDSFQADLLTGWIDCTLETNSPTYIRGMLNETDWKKYNDLAFEGLNKEDAQRLKDERDQASAPFFSTSEKKEGEKFFKPAIPGSSLRGMIRALVEVVGYGRMRWVGNQPTVTFRAVAAESSDPLRNPYRDFIGSNGKNVRAGFLVQDGEKWFIQPAKNLREINYKTNDRYFLKVDEDDINSKDLPHFIKMFTNEYHPQIHEISFAAGSRKSKRTDPKRTRPSVVVKPRSAKLGFDGLLVCSGDMVETGNTKQESTRAKHYIILPPGRAPRIPIPDETIIDYRSSLTSFQKEQLTDWAGGEWGCLGNGKPVFYVVDNPDNPSKVLFFGHNPNFRIPALIDKHAATPLSFVPDSLRNDSNPDLADAIFGWVEEKDPANPKEILGPTGSVAGRVSFSDAVFTSAANGLWYSEEPISLKILASPKPTTFQHYLVQDREKGHDPDRKSQLAHYETPTSQTSIRGHKFYWNKGSDPDIVASPKDLDKPSQLTRVVPIKPGVRFNFKIHFENLQPEELGALWWVLTLGDQTKTHRHRIGMGKPLGMGAVTLQPVLHLSNRLDSDSGKGRYGQIFAENYWHQPEASETDSARYMRDFETYILKFVDANKTHLDQVERIQALLEILQWRGDHPDNQWLDLTRYMEIEHEAGEKKYNEYKERPVLPQPNAIQTRLNRPAKESAAPAWDRDRKSRR